ncbi:FHA domain-containing protein [Lachnospiraceae bacterium C1.1]|nr:FHA domain-containing protein [Lachnospiraceae bacterium C1.1]
MRIKSKIKGFVCFLAVSVITVVSTVSAASDEALRIAVDRYVAEDGLLKLYVNHNRDGQLVENADQISVMFGNNEMQLDSFSTLAEQEVPVSFQCVVDVSGSMSQERIDEAKEIIKKIAELKKDSDSISITSMGDNLVSSSYMTDKAEIETEADKLTVTHEDTNLYYAIVEEIKSLETDNNVNRKRCLIIFSDGADEQATGVTKEEAENAVKESHIPVFTVGLLENAKNQNSQEMAKILGSFARISSGGRHFAPALSDGTDESIPNDIVTRLNNSLVLNEKLEGIDASAGREVLLKVKISPNSGETAEDSMNIPESDLKIIREEQEKIEPTEVTEEPTEITEEPTEEAKESTDTIFGLNPIIFWIIVCLIIIFIILLIVVMILRKKAAEAVEEYDEEGDDGEESYTEYRDENSHTMGFDSDSRTIGLDDDAGPTAAFSESGVTQGFEHKSQSSNKFSVTLFRLGKDDGKRYKFDLSDRYTVGRSTGKSKLAFSDDTALSGLHCSFFVKKNEVFIKDENSTNGTFVNGVPIQGEFKLSQDDTILIGSYEYRITWK